MYFHSINLKFYEKTKILFVTKFYLVNGGNSGVKNKMLNNGLILTGKYLVKIYTIKLHTKNHVDWIKSDVLREVLSLLYNLIPGSW